MHRAAALSLLVLFAGELSAQTVLEPVPIGNVRHAGTYFAATRTFVPSAPPGIPMGGPIYNNSAGGDNAFDFSDGTLIIDEGILPGPTNPFVVGTQRTYLINSFDIGYVTGALDPSLGGPGAHLQVGLYETYEPCSSLEQAGPPSAFFDLTGMPGSMLEGNSEGLIVTVDLRGMEICFKSDGTTVFENGLEDFFGYSLRILEEEVFAGFIIAGDPINCPAGTGLAFNEPAGCDSFGTGSGFGNLDVFYLDPLGCASFGGFPAAPYSGFYFVLESELLGECLANDDCDRACLVTTANSVEWDTTEATTDGAPDPACDAFGSAQIENDVWFAFRPAISGTYELSTVGGTELDTRLAVFDGGDCANALVLACNDDAEGTLQSAVTIDAECGERYLVRLGSFAAGDTGSGELAINLVANAPAAAENYCVTGMMGSEMGFQGSLDVSDNGFVLTATGVPDTFGLFIFANQQAFSPIPGIGVLCVGGAAIFRLDPRSTPSSGVATRALDFTDVGAFDSVITPGTCWNFQYLFRSPPAFSGAIDLSDGLAVQFGP